MKKQILAGLILMTLTLATPTAAQSPTATCVMMRGIIDTYGGETVARGWCGAYAINESGNVHAFWIPLTPSPPIGGPSEENFIFSFYMAKMINGSAELNPTADVNLTISGEWDVYNVTFGYHGELRNSTKEVVKTEVPGELNVTDWSSFAISIDGIELNGTVLFHRVMSTPIPRGDVAGPPEGVPPEEAADGKIDIWDLVHVAKAYGDTPGIGNYDFSMDLDFDFKIDLTELTTIAANLGEEY